MTANKTKNTWTRPTLKEITEAIIEMGESTVGEILNRQVFAKNKKVNGKSIPAVSFTFHWFDGTEQKAEAYNFNGETVVDW